jgi:type I restriction-modification system DNA methylase subunit
MSNKEEAKKEISRLVDKYRKVIAEDKLKDYKEESTKTSFILPLFRALGWEVENNDEVHPEEQVSRGRVDYTFKINGVLKFVLEAKPLKTSIDRTDWSEQAIGYAWHKGCTWAMLTNFESLKIFNAEIKAPSPSQSLLKTIECTSFLERFDELWLLSRESFEQGLLDKEAEKWHKKSKKIPIDKQLLTDFTHFREILSKSILKLNPGKDLSEEDVDETVQRILDRLIFIRNCEDRELESKKLLEVAHESSVLKHLRELFSYYDKTYDSKIFTYDAFNPKKVHECDIVKIDDEVMREVITGLYSTKDASVSYDFSAIEADVLGNIYEQYLGHILKKSPKRAKLKESQAHRKEQGIYYTPTYIVDYIVRNTLGELLDKTSVSDIPKIKVLDPACGSGSFLIKAFDVICEAYMKKTKSSKATFEQKKSILQNNLYGVDLDPKAVEIAQLNLLLKAAEKGKSLPVLENNIKCGNSLIDDESVAPGRAFKWEEQFPEIMKRGGFDVVVGNPPYGAEFTIEEKKFFNKSYQVSEYQLDSYILFLEKCIELLKNKGVVGLIVPNPWLTNIRLKKLRGFILNNCRILNIVYISQKVFKDATVDTANVILQKESDKNLRLATKIKINIAKTKALSDQEKIIEQSRWASPDSNNFNIFLDDISFTLSTKIKHDSNLLTDLFEVRAGIEPYEVGKGEPKQTQVMVENKVYNAEKKKDNTYLPYLRGGDIFRYGTKWDSTHWISYGLWLAAPRKAENFEKVKIVLRQTGDSLIAVLDDENYLTMKNTHIILPRGKDSDLNYCLALINSKLMTYYFRTLNPEKGEALAEVKAEYVKQLPIKKSGAEQQKRLVILVDKMISLNKRLISLGDKQTDARAKLEAEIKKTDAEIDDLVYKIYDITDKERKIIEESLKS